MKKELAPVNIDKEIHQRLKHLLKSYPKVGHESISKFVNEAINKELQSHERQQAIDDWGKLRGSGQYQKIKQLESDIRKLKKQNNSLEEHVKTTDNLDARLSKLDKKIDQQYKETQRGIASRIQNSRAVIELLKSAKKNPILKKELDKIK